ncbi:redoxin domain-containing protein [bacterium]|nr:MAG: redoxin domain-containing protein [bacterium]
MSHSTFPRALVLGLLTASLFHGAKAQAPRNRSVHIEGTVTDAQGKPVVGARIAPQWSYNNGKFIPASATFTTDDSGKFSGDLPLFRDWTGLLAVDAANNIADVQLLGDEQLKQPLTFKLEPLVPVEFSVTAKELPGFKEENGLELFVAKDDSTGDTDETQAYLLDLNIGKQPLRVPAGAYRLLVRSNNIRYFQQRFAIPPASPALNLGELVAPASKLGMLFGKPAPSWTAQATRGITPTTTIDNYKGKWLVVEFWAHWCIPCVTGGIPRLKRFYELHNKERDKFEAIAIHDSSLKTLDEVDLHTAKVKQAAWDNQPLPFPIILDKDKRTFSDWGVGAIPCVLLVSPEGTLIRTDEPLTYLETQLKKAQ